MKPISRSKESGDISTEPYYSSLNEEREEGIAIGVAKGRKAGKEEGKEEGRKEEQRSIANQMLAKGMDKTLISEVTGLTLKEIESLI